MKNNFITKIIGATLAFTMMIGGAVGINAAKQAKMVYAETGTMAASTNSSAATVNGKTAIKCGTGSAKGKMTITLSNAGATTLSVYVAGWNNDTGRTVNVTVTAGVTISPTSFTVANESGISGSGTSYTVANEATHLKEFTLSDAVAGTVVTFEAQNASKNRYVAWGATYEVASGGDPNKADVSLSCADLELDIADPATALTVTATSGGEPVNGLEYTYEMENESVATVTDEGVVTPVAVGETELTISFAGDENYNPTSETISVVVSDRTQAVSSLVFGSACGGTGTADDGAIWTVTSDGNESNFDGTSGIHYGTGSANVTYLQLSTTDLKGDIKQVVVNARDAQATATVSVSVGETDFTCAGSSTATNTSTDYTFTGNARGAVVVRIDRGSSMSKALYVKSIVVTFTKINLSSIALSGDYQTTFNQGDAFDHDGMVVTATYDDDSNENVTALATWTGYSMNTIGEQTVTVTYKTKTANYTINVVAATMYSVTGSITNGSLSSEDDVQENAALNITINADARYSRPTSLTVTMGNASYNGYSYNSSTGVFYIEHVTGDVTITGTCPKTHGYWPEDPFTVTEARNLIDAQNTVNGVYATGIVTEIVTPFDQQYGNISYNISADGLTTSNQLQAYRGKNLNNTAFTSANDVQVGATVVIYGNLKKHNSTYEFDSGNYLVSYGNPTNETIINAYKSTASSVTSINGVAQSTSNVQPENIVFADLGLSNGTQYLDPFDGGHFTITFAGGGNDGKYYDGGTGIRTYSNGSFTIASEEDITKIELTWDGSNKPNTNVASVGTYNKDTGIWSGDATNSVTFTRPTADGHWRLQSVTVTYGTINGVNSLALRFGASIPVASWNAINDNEDLEITDYGVMLFKTRAQNAETAPTVQSLYSTNPEYVEVFNKGSGIAPTAEDEKYTFTARIDYPNDSEYSKYIIAQAFIVINGTNYCFLGEEMRESVRSLAGAANVDTNLSPDALTYLTTAGN